MSHIAAATVQNVWDCRYSRPGYRLTHVDDHEQPETVWVCIRTGRRRAVSDAECESCPHWVQDDREDLPFAR